jgi:hypothetical protein
VWVVDDGAGSNGSDEIAVLANEPGYSSVTADYSGSYADVTDGNRVVH